MAEKRDERIGAALALLDFPEHGPEFWSRLESELVAESGRPAHEHASRRGSPRAPRGRWLAPRTRWALAAAALACAVVAALSLLLAGSPLRTQPASAVEVAREVSRALGSARSLAGVVRIRGVPDEGGNLFEDRWSFVITAEGDYLLRQRLSSAEQARGRREVQAYDSRSRVATDISVPAAPIRGAFAARTVGVPPGGADPAPLPDLLRRDLGATVRGLAEAGEASVEETTFDGRPAWRLATEVTYDGRPSGRVVALVDRQTAVPVRIVRVVGGRVVSDTRLEELVVDGPVRREAFRPGVPAGVPLERRDLGVRLTTVERAPALAGFQSPRPRGLPGGFRLSEVAVNERPEPSGLRADNPVAGPVVALSYRRGLERIGVTARPAGPRPGRWRDPFIGEGFARERRTVVLRRGALAGARAWITVDPLGPPQLWALGDELVVTISGPLGRDGLVRAAQSLR